MSKLSSIFKENLNMSPNFSAYDRISTGLSSAWNTLKNLPLRQSVLACVNFIAQNRFSIVIGGAVLLAGVCLSRKCYKKEGGTPLCSLFSTCFAKKESQNKAKHSIPANLDQETSIGNEVPSNIIEGQDSN